MATAPQEPASTKNRSLQRYLQSEPILFLMLLVLAIAFFLVVTGLSRLYRAQQQSLGDRWFGRGLEDLKERRFGPAVLEFRTALRYSRDDSEYQFNLAQALLGLNRTNEAQSYLINLWDREPENGQVNLALARIAAQTGEKEKALRYYHNAIYATWPGDEEVQRRETRVELIDYLLKIRAREQAEAELIALQANVGDDAEQQRRIGDLFMRAQDYEHALNAYRSSLHVDRHNEQALAGAGWAAFASGQYQLAQRYLQSAVAADSEDLESAERLKLTNLVLQMDPFQRGISVAHRNRMVVDAFAIAGQRLQACGASAGSIAPAGSQSGLADTWNELKPKITERGLARDPDLVESTMDLVFEIERGTAGCGVSSQPDQALLLISNLHGGQ